MLVPDRIWSHIKEFILKRSRFIELDIEDLGSLKPVLDWIRVVEAER